MEEFIVSIQDQIDQLASTFESAGMVLDVSARGNSLVYSYQYKIDIGDASIVKETLESAMDSMSATYSQLFSMLKTAVPEAESVIIECSDKNGEILFSKEYK